MTPSRIRKELLILDKSELQVLNDGFEALVAVEGPGGYQQIAGVYGKPGTAGRPTEPLLFLPWHRAYLLAFDQALDRATPGCCIAYWDLTNEWTIHRGIPNRLRSVAYSDNNQGIWLNALSRAPIDCIGHQYYTERSPGQPADLRPLVDKVVATSSYPLFEDFSRTLEEASREFRAWAGGHLNDDDYAAYDPLFWFHHANLDRLWARWQESHSAATLPESLLDTPLEPFAVKVRDVLDINRLGYSYQERSVAAAAAE